MNENKQAILDALVECLRLTMDQQDLLNLQYDEKREVVWITWENGNKPVNVAMDSGIAMIRDVLNAMR